MGPTLASKMKTDRKKPGYFLGGFDFIFDKNLTPWLLEINFNPGVSCTNRHVNVYKHSVPDLIDVAIEPMLSGKEPKLGNWEKIF